MYKTYWQKKINVIKKVAFCYPQLPFSKEEVSFISIMSKNLIKPRKQKQVKDISGNAN